MKHTGSETPAYLIWVEQRPTMNGKGKKIYYDAVRSAAQAEIVHPIATDDIDVEVVYATNQNEGERKDADNVNKPTLDALEGVAYNNDRQVRSVTCTVFDKKVPLTVDGSVEHMGRLFYSGKPHVVLIMVYCDTRLAELGGAQELQRQRHIEWKRNFNQLVSMTIKTSS